MSKKPILCILAALLILAIIPVAIFAQSAMTDSPYEDSYYAELSEMYSRLKNSDGKKIVIIGNSNVAFGVHSACLEEMLRSDGENYTVCNFGLYGAIGTRAMLELAKDYVGDGDIVLFIPEPIEQSMSLYFSAGEMWRALDSDVSMFWHLDDRESLVGNYVQFSSEKYLLNKSGQSLVSGVYAKSSFDENCDMTVYKREHNVFASLYDENNPVSFDTSMLDVDFVNYVNDFSTAISARGAKMYFSFSPVNELAVEDEESIDVYFDALSKSLNFPLLGNPHTYVMDGEWFYDNNFHLNYSGMYVRTISLYQDLMVSAFGKTPQNYELPQKPTIQDTETAQGDNSDENMFVYEFDSEKDTFVVVGLSDEGHMASSLTIPVSHNGKSVVGYTATAFNNCANLVEIVVQTNVKLLYNNSFLGCSSLRRIVIVEPDPNKIATGYNVLAGTVDCNFYVKEDSLGKYFGHYTWGHLSDHIKSCSTER